MENFLVLISASRNRGSMLSPGHAIRVVARFPKLNLSFSAVKGPLSVLHPPFPLTVIFFASKDSFGILPPSATLNCCASKENSCQSFFERDERDFDILLVELQEASRILKRIYP